ncbi:hypothetical protein V5E97_09740 [Singulisphaera sp. Ch08]|uniref:Transposase n=1 Tax=Singulisphaera sp. Ch08 TaxID=3120278 RepID=A0AAU7CMG9_9BACT
MRKPSDLTARFIAAKCPPCKDCGSRRLKEVRIKRGRHAAKVVCDGCDRFVAWIPKVRFVSCPPPAELLDRAVRLGRPAAHLRGESDEQITGAISVRAKMFAQAKRRRDLGRAMVLRAIADAGWFCANARAAYDKIVWPTPDQLDSPDEVEAPTIFTRPPSDPFDFLNSLRESEESLLDTGWFAVLDDRDLDQGGADLPRQLELEAAPPNDITEFPSCSQFCEGLQCINTIQARSSR